MSDSNSDSNRDVIFTLSVPVDPAARDNIHSLIADVQQLTDAINSIPKVDVGLQQSRQSFDSPESQAPVKPSTPLASSGIGSLHSPFSGVFNINASASVSGVANVDSRLANGLPVARPIPIAQRIPVAQQISVAQPTLPVSPVPVAAKPVSSGVAAIVAGMSNENIDEKSSPSPNGALGKGNVGSQVLPYATPISGWRSDAEQFEQSHKKMQHATKDTHEHINTLAHSAHELKYGLLETTKALGILVVGFGHLGLAAEHDVEKVMHGVLKLQAATKLIKGGTMLFKGIGRMRGSMAAGVAESAAGGAATEAVAGEVAAGGGAASGGASAIGGAALAPIAAAAAALAAVAAAGLAVKDTFQGIASAGAGGGMAHGSLGDKIASFESGLGVKIEKLTGVFGYMANMPAPEKLLTGGERETEKDTSLLGRAGRAAMGVALGPLAYAGKFNPEMIAAARGEKRFNEREEERQERLRAQYRLDLAGGAIGAGVVKESGVRVARGDEEASLRGAGWQASVETGLTRSRGALAGREFLLQSRLGAMSVESTLAQRLALRGQQGELMEEQRAFGFATAGRSQEGRRSELDVRRGTVERELAGLTGALKTSDSPEKEKQLVQGILDLRRKMVDFSKEDMAIQRKTNEEKLAAVRSSIASVQQEIQLRQGDQKEAANRYRSAAERYGAMQPTEQMQVVQTMQKLRQHQALVAAGDMKGAEALRNFIPREHLGLVEGLRTTESQRLTSQVKVAEARRFGFDVMGLGAEEQREGAESARRVQELKVQLQDQRNLEVNISRNDEEIIHRAAGVIREELDLRDERMLEIIREEVQTGKRKAAFATNEQIAAGAKSRSGAVEH